MAQQNLDIYIRAVDGFSSVFDSAERRAASLGNTLQKVGQTSGSREASKIGRIIEAVADGGKDMQAESMQRRVAILHEHRTITDEIVRIQRLGTTTAAEWTALESQRVDIAKKAAAAYEEQGKQLRTDRVNAFITRLGAGVGIAELIGNRLQKISAEYERIRKSVDETNAGAAVFAGEMARALPGVGSLAKGFDGIRDTIIDMVVRMGDLGNEADNIRAARVANAVLTLGGSELTGSMSGYEARLAAEKAAAIEKDVSDFRRNDTDAKKRIDAVVGSVDGSRNLNDQERAAAALNKQLKDINEAREAAKKTVNKWDGSDAQEKLAAAELEARKQYAARIEELAKREVGQSEESAKRRIEIERDVQTRRQEIFAQSLRAAGQELDADLAEIESRHQASIEKIADQQKEIWERFNEGKIDRATRDSELRTNDQDVENSRQQRSLDEDAARRDEEDRKQSEADRRKRAADDADGVIRRAEMTEYEVMSELGDKRAKQALERLRVDEKYLSIQKQLTEIINDQTIAQDVRAKAAAQLADNEALKQRELASIEKNRINDFARAQRKLFDDYRGFESTDGFGGGLAASIAQMDRLKRLAELEPGKRDSSTEQQAKSQPQAAPSIPSPNTQAATTSNSIAQQTNKDAGKVMTAEVVPVLKALGATLEEILHEMQKAESV